MESRKIVDMIESREAQDVSKWLKQYPNISIVSRDGSLTYASAIRQAHPEAIQISDRFHLIKNLTERATEAFQKLFQGCIIIPLTDERKIIQTNIQLGNHIERAQIVKRLKKEGRSKKELCLVAGISLRSLNRYLSIENSEIIEEKPTVRALQHTQAIEKLEIRADKVRKMHAEGYSITEISLSTGFTYRTVKNYLSDNFSPVNGHYGKSQGGKLFAFKDEIWNMRFEGITYKKIHEIISAKGYDGTVDAIRGFMSKERRIRCDLQISADSIAREFIDKKWLIQLLFKPMEKIKGINESQLSVIFTQYPLAEKIISLVNEFRVILKSKNPVLLFPWLNKVSELNVAELNRFIKGVHNDLAAVTNAIKYDYSNGLAEGTVNKIKVIKRIMYGRCNFDMLKNKCLLAQDFD